MSITDAKEPALFTAEAAIQATERKPIPEARKPGNGRYAYE